MSWLKETALRLAPAALLLGVIAAISAVVGLYRTYVQSDVRIYVDNGASQPIEVRLDGKQALTVAAGTVGVIKCRHGEKRLEVTRAGATVFDHVVSLVAPEYREPRKYVLDPEGAHRYWIRTVAYGASIPQFRTYYDEADRYRQLAGTINLVPAGKWMEAKHCEFVLDEPVPEKVKGHFSDTRSVFSRMGREDYALISQAQNRGFQEPTPSSSEYQTLEACVERLEKVRR